MPERRNTERGEFRSVKGRCECCERQGWKVSEVEVGKKILRRGLDKREKSDVWEKL